MTHKPETSSGGEMPGHSNSGIHRPRQASFGLCAGVCRVRPGRQPTGNRLALGSAVVC